MSTKPSAWRFCTSLLFVLLLAVLFRSLVVEPFHIPSGSMKGSLLVGDYVLVSKHEYGYSRYSFPFSTNLFSGRIFSSAVRPGDVVVFRPPHETGVNYVKRAIGVAGDKVQIKGGGLYINGVKMKHERTGDFIDKNADGKEISIPCYVETLHNGRSYEVLDEDFNSPLDNTPVYQVPQGAIFVLGDNRDNSRDSRFINDVGFIPLENIVGRAVVVVLSFYKSGDGWFPYRIRLDRIWHGVR